MSKSVVTLNSRHVNLWSYFDGDFGKFHVFKKSTGVWPKVYSNLELRSFTDKQKNMSNRIISTKKQAYCLDSFTLTVIDGYILAISFILKWYRITNTQKWPKQININLYDNFKRKKKKYAKIQNISHKKIQHTEERYSFI